MIVPCECGAKLRIDDSKIESKGVKVRCPRCGNVIVVQKQPSTPEPFVSAAPLSSPGQGGDIVLIAHDSEVVRDMIGGILLDAGFRVETAADGVETLKKAEETNPQVLLLDVGLPGVYGFELCERLKEDGQTKGIKIILLASVYDMTRYKRTPVSLYGADDYIEKHHIADDLPHKINKLIHPEQYAAAPAKTAVLPSYAPAVLKPVSREFSPAELGPESTARPGQGSTDVSGTARPAVPPADREGTLPYFAADLPQAASESQPITPESFSLDASIFQKEECDIPRVDEADPEALEKARRFARIIVSDIALYNQEAVAEGLRNGTFYELLKNDIDEGRELFEKRVPSVIRSQKDYYQEAFDNFIAAQKNVR